MHFNSIVSHGRNVRVNANSNTSGELIDLLP